MTASTPQVLLVEDEPQMRRFLRVALESAGYRYLDAATGQEGLDLAALHRPQVILLDLGLPDMDGLDMMATLREWSQAPVIVISARGQEADKVKALDNGADDYLTKPFGTSELLARIRVALRHADPGAPEEPVFSLGRWRVDLPKRQVQVDGHDEPLLRGDQLFRAVHVSAGEHAVHFFFAPQSVRLGLIVSSLAILATALLFGWTLRPGRAIRRQ